MTRTEVIPPQQPQLCRWHACPDSAALNAAAADFILAAAARAIAARGEFNVVLAGGTTPRAVYASLRETHTAWPAWQVYFRDERCVPANHPMRNSLMARAALFEHVPVPRTQFHVIPAERGARRAAAEYAALLEHVPLFDLVMLGLGEDGHTASLFPGADQSAAPDSPAVLPVSAAPKQPRERVTLGARRLSAARQALFLVAGAAKREAVRRWRAGVNIPAAGITPAAGVDVMLDAALLA